MDENNQAPNNVLQFPNRKKEAEPAPNKSEKSSANRPAKPKASKKTLVGTVLAVILFSAAANRFVFEGQNGSLEQASLDGGRKIASIQKSWHRNADWEKDLAEKLASTQARSLASISIGRAATKEEKLRWGVLEEKYTITFSDDHRIESVLLQDAQSSPSYILNRDNFLNEYGSLLQSDFASAKLDNSHSVDGKTTEVYTIFGQDGKPRAEARFELDQHKRLLSLKVESKAI